MRRIFLLLAGICLMLAMLSCRSNNNAKLRIGIIKPSIDHLPLSLALKNHYLNPDKFDIIYFTSGWETQEAIAADRIDLAIMPFTYAWTAVAKGHKLQIVSCLERETDGIMTAADIDSLAELDGEKIGLLRASTLEILMQDTAKFNSFTYEPIYFRTPTELVAALQSREVTAIVCYVPIIEKMSDAYHVLHWFSESYPGHPCCDLIATENTLKTQSGKIKDIKSALEKAINDINESTPEAFALLSEMYHLDEKQANDALQHTVFNLSLTESDMMFERQMMESFLEIGYLKQLPSDDEVFAK